MAKGKEHVANWLIQGHRGKDIQPGEKVRMSDEEAAPLIACGALSVVGDQEAEEGEASDSFAE
jgi:hypothetical protein